MRVAMVAAGYPPSIGGVETYLTGLIPKLRECRVEVDVLCRYGRNTSVRSPLGWREEDGLNVFRTLSATSLVLELRKLCKGDADQRPDLVHFHYSRSLVVPLLSIVFGNRLVVTLHGGLQGPAHDEYVWRQVVKASQDRWIAPWFLRRVEMVVAISQAELRGLGRFGIDQDRVVFLPSAVPAEAIEFTGAESGGSGWLLVLARISQEKRIGDLIDALSRFPALPGCDIAGPDGDDSTRVRRAASKLEPDRVRFLGEVHGMDRLKLLRRAVALVLPSEREGLPLAAYESLAVGTPVIGTYNALEGLGSRGILKYQTGNVADLAVQLGTLSRPTELSQLQDGAKLAALSLPRFDDLAKDMADLYRAVVSSARSTDGWNTP